MTRSRIIVAALAVIAIAIGLFRLESEARGLRTETLRIGSAAVTLFAPSRTPAAGIVVIAHGFAGSQQLMRSFALTLAQAGYLAVTFDCLGHGRNLGAMVGDVTEETGITGQLVNELRAVIAGVRDRAPAGVPVAVLGHSMASDIVIRAAQAEPQIAATVAVSVFSPVVTATSPRNLLVIVGAWEPAFIRDEALRLLRLSAGAQAVAGRTYGSFADGTARRVDISPDVEHIAVLFSAASLQAARMWIDDAFGHHTSTGVAASGFNLLLLLAGLIALAWPLCAMLPHAMEPSAAVPIHGRQRMGWLLVPAVLTPLILWKMPSHFLPIIVGDYLALHFLVYGLVTAGVIAFLRKRSSPVLHGQTSPGAVLAATAVLVLYDIAAIGGALDRYVFSFMPVGERWLLILALLCGTLPCFVADEWLTRRMTRSRFAYPLSKVLFVLSLAAAIALNPSRLFFLIIIAPAIALLFVAFGLISRWAHNATGHPLPGAISNALLFAWGIAVTFPLVIN